MSEEVKTVSDVKYIKEELLDIFPEAERGSVSKSKYGKGRKLLHLNYWVSPDTVGGTVVLAKSNLLYFIEWNTNEGYNYIFAESCITTFISRVRLMYSGRKEYIEKTVKF